MDAFAGLYAEVLRMDRICSLLQAQGHDVEDYSFLEEWLDEQRVIGLARDGWRSNQVLEGTKGRDVDAPPSERYMEPEYNRGQNGKVGLR